MNLITFSPSVSFVLITCVCFILPWFGSCEASYSRANSSNVCSRLPAQSCAHQTVQSDGIVDPESCLVQVTDGCSSNKVWDYQETCQKDSSTCGVGLEVYRHALSHIPLYRTALNLTLSNVQPHDTVRIRYRYMLSDNFSYCINFTRNVQQELILSEPPASLWYDCIFFKRFYEGKSFIMEFMHGNKYGMFSFLIPTGEI